MTKLTHNGQQFTWNEIRETSFQELKKYIVFLPHSTKRSRYIVMSMDKN